MKLGTSPMPLTSKIKSGLVKVPIHFNVYSPEFVTKCSFKLVTEKVMVTDCNKEGVQGKWKMAITYPAMKKDSAGLADKDIFHPAGM